ncbi:hypothetical protein BH11PLA2_BH11PLA2_46610 [soil metagenome]
MIEVTGSVLGVDVGYSPKKATTCFCVLRWSQSLIEFKFELVGVDPSERCKKLKSILSQDESLDAAAIDGPLTHGLTSITHYRATEALLSRGVLQKRGKPGQTSSPTGLKLHQHANELARIVLAENKLANANHFQAIHEKRLVEAFPNLFLAAIINESNLPLLKRDASDRYWEYVTQQSSILINLINFLLPGRQLLCPLQNYQHHDHRAGVICALTALSVVSGHHISAGDPSDGDIVLPPLSVWGTNNNHNSY